ncbi:hypothetical protein HK096_010703 [Nowakowskiella sp. JEL0078]|nr:hypothetical protein HK096_010703 [Nowakowskiella sp. JEL0078]
MDTSSQILPSLAASGALSPVKRSFGLNNSFRIKYSSPHFPLARLLAIGDLLFLGILFRLLPTAAYWWPSAIRARSSRPWPTCACCLHLRRRSSKRSSRSTWPFPLPRSLKSLTTSDSPCQTRWSALCKATLLICTASSTLGCVSAATCSFRPTISPLLVVQ